jgi:hypothetical protein
MTSSRMALVGSALVACSFGPLAARAQTPLQCAADQIFSTQAFVTAGAIQRHVEASDLNGDQILDLVISTSNSIVIAIGAPGPNGLLSYAVLATYPAGQDPTGTAIGDFNGDNIKDLAVACDGGGVRLFRGQGNGIFAQYNELPLGGAWDVATADLNADGIRDLVVAARAGHIISLLGVAVGGVANGTFQEVVRVGAGGSCKGLELADLDEDGILDVAVALENQFISVLLGNGTQGVGDGSFSFIRQLTAVGTTYDVTSGDFNHDGTPDLASANYQGGSISVFLGAGNLAYGGAIHHTSPGSPLGIASEDFDRDGYDDLVVAATGGGAAFAYFHNTGSLAISPDGFVSFNAFGPNLVGYGISTGDLNADGSVDVVVPNIAGNQLLAAYNRCPGSNNYHVLTTTVTGSGTIVRAPNLSSYETGTIVELTAMPAGGWAFSHWSGDASGSANPTSIEMNTSHQVMATFVQIQRVLTVSYAGNGVGTVTRSPDQPTYNMGTVVRLTAVPQFGSLFTGWSGDVTSTSNPLDVPMDTDKSITATFVVDESLAPRIVSIADVPLDQGGKVKLRWLASSLEVPGSDPQNLVTQYYVWREVPEGVYLQARAAASASTPALFHRTATAEREYFWEFVVALPASRFQGYSYTAATTSDSSDLGNPFTAFLVQARNAGGTRWFDSSPDSGYSVDNLVPPAPGPVAATYGATANSFHWRPSPAPDLRSYHLHRGTAPDFVPTTSNLLVETQDTSFVDPQPIAYYYKLAAVDVHGNRSSFVAISPGTPVPAVASLVRAEGREDRIELSWYVSEPGVPVTLHRRSTDSEWQRIAQLHADGRGFLDYQDFDVIPGRRYRYRLGIMDGGAEAFFAETEVLAEEPRFAIEAVPNPARGNELTVRFSLAQEAPATVDLLDISGRLISRWQVDGRPGRQSLGLAQGTRIEPGLYWVRLRQRGMERSIRAVVVD